MLSSELASEFRGRSLSRELFPLSFSEFVRRMGDTNLSRLQGLSSADAAVARGALSEYLLRGGYMAALDLPVSDGMMLMQEYAYRTVAMDVVERYNLRTPQIATSLTRCIASSGRELSVNKVVNEFKSRGASTSRETVSNLLSYYEEAYLVFSLSDLNRSLANNPRSSSKVYAVDPGMFAAFSPAASKEEGQRLETAVFNKTAPLGPSSAFRIVARLTFEHEGGSHEVDFVMGDALLGDVFQLVQVDIDMANLKTRRRELAAVEAAMEKYGINESTIVTMDFEETIEMGSGVVRIDVRGNGCSTINVGLTGTCVARSICRAIGVNAARIRRQKGKSQSFVADRAGMDRSALNKLESGKSNTIGGMALQVRRWP